MVVGTGRERKLKEKEGNEVEKGIELKEIMDAVDGFFMINGHQQRASATC